MYDYEKQAKIIIKTAMVKQDIDYQALRDLLAKNDINITKVNLVNKINRGKFSFAFALCLFKVLNIKINLG